MNQVPVTLSGMPGAPVDVKNDPRIRYTLVDVAMKLAHDLPWYFVCAVLFVLALRGTTNTLETMNGIALILLGRSRAPEAPDKAHLIRGIVGGLLVLLVVGAVHVAIAPAPSPPRVSGPRVVLLEDGTP